MISAAIINGPGPVNGPINCSSNGTLLAAGQSCREELLLGLPNEVDYGDYGLSTVTDVRVVHGRAQRGYL